jgi:TfoX/Sxy family transcriptional regulator of competence genes
MQYYSVPAAILEDSDELIDWAKKSVEVSRAQRASPPARQGRVKSKRSRKPSSRRAT